MYKIEIHGKADMDAIMKALDARYIKADKDKNSVSVEPREVDKAVEIINKLGYKTTEDHQ